MLKMKIVSTSVRTAGVTRGPPDALGDVASEMLPLRGIPTVRRQPHAGHQHGAEGDQAGLCAERPQRADGEQGRADRRPGELVERDEPGQHPGVGGRQIARAGRASAPASGWWCPRTPRRWTARRARHSTTPIEATSVTIASASTASTTARSPLTTVTISRRFQPVGEGAGQRREQQRRQPLERRRQRHEERVVGERGDEQRAGGQGDAVAEIGHPGRRRAASGRRPRAGTAQRSRRGGSQVDQPRGQASRRRLA